MKVLHTQWVMNTRPALLESKGVSTGVALHQRVQQYLRLLQVSGVKALGEPAVDRCQQFVGFGALALALPEASEAGGRPQLQGLDLLTPGDGEGVLKTGDGLRLLLRRVSEQQLSLEPIRLCRIIMPANF